MSQTVWLKGESQEVGALVQNVVFIRKEFLLLLLLLWEYTVIFN